MIIDQDVDQSGIDPDNIRFTAGVLQHAELTGVTLKQMKNALRQPRWVNLVRHQPDPRNQSAPRLRYCGFGVAVIVEDDAAIAVIADDLSKGPRQRQPAVGATL